MSDQGPQSPFPPPVPPSMTPPPGYVAYGGPGSAMPGNLQRIGRLTTAVVALQVAAVVLGLVSLAVQLRLTGKANDFLDNVITEREFEDARTPLVLVGGLAGAVTIALLVVSIIWSYRIATNLVATGRQITWKPGLTIVAWLLGGCTLQIITFLMLREHWKASDAEVHPGDPSWKERTPPASITAWFVTALAGLAVGFTSASTMITQGFDIGSETEDIAESLSGQVTATAISGLLAAAAGIVLVVVIRQLAARHMRLTRET